MPLMDIHSSHVIYGDDEIATTNPKLVYVDWARHVNATGVERPESKSFDILPGQSLTLFSGVRTTSIDGTTAFSLALNPIQSGLYRLTSTGGTAPAFRTARAYNATSVPLTLVVNNNSTLEITQGSGNFGATVGDQVLIPGTTTGDAASPFSPLNVGSWVVLSATTLKLTLARPVGLQFEGAAESVTPASASQFQIFSAAGVQPGDNLEISAGFSSVTQQAFVVTSVTPTWVEFVSTQSLPLETGILPTSTGLTFYTTVKRFLRVEVSQDAVIRFNADASNNNRCSPIVAGDVNQMGYQEKFGSGPIWQLVVVNRSVTSTMTINMISAE